MLEAKKVFKIFSGVLQKIKIKKRSSRNFFRRSPKKRSSNKFFRHLQNFTNSKKILLSSGRVQGNFRGLNLRGQGHQNVSSWPKPFSRTPPLIFVISKVFGIEKIRVLGRGQYPHALLNNFSEFFGNKNTIFVTLTKITHLDFQSNSKKKYRKYYVRKTLVFSQFPDSFLSQSYLYISVHFVFFTSNNACKWMSANVSAIKRHFLKFSIRYLITKILRISAGSH